MRPLSDGVAVQFNEEEVKSLWDCVKERETGALERLAKALVHLVVIRANILKGSLRCVNLCAHNLAKCLDADLVHASPHLSRSQLWDQKVAKTL